MRSGVEWRTLEKDWRWTEGGLHGLHMDWRWTGGGLHEDPWVSVRYRSGKKMGTVLSCLYDKDVNKVLRNLVFLLKEGGAYLCIDPLVPIIGMSDLSI